MTWTTPRTLLSSLMVLAVIGLAQPVSAATPPSAAASHAGAAQDHRGGPRARGYTNPLVDENAPDPTVIRAQDGNYYLYTTSTYLKGDPRPHTMPIFRSSDMVSWDYVGDVFDEAPEWVTSPVGAWAPDVHYMNGKYYLYYSTSQTKALPRYHSPAGAYAIGVATAPTPTGPWVDAGPAAGGDLATGPIVKPEWGWCTNPDNAGCYNWIIDSHVYQGKDGTRYLYEGSYFGGNRLHQLSTDGLTVKPGTAVQYGHQLRYEGSFLWPHLVGRQRMYYMIGSQSNCCEGANSPYSISANRGNQPYGNLNPDGSRSNFVDHNGLPMQWMYGPPPELQPGGDPSSWPGWWNLAGMAGGYPTLRQNGNGVVGAGHQVVIQDLAGQDWMYYHGVREDDPWGTSAGQTEGGLKRQLYLDRMDWTTEGWPLVNDGDGPTRGGAAPIATPQLGDNFNGPTHRRAGQAAPAYRGKNRVHWRDAAGRWVVRRDDRVSGGYLRQKAARGRASTASRDGAPYTYKGVHAECDVRAISHHGTYGCALTFGRDTRPRARKSRIEVSVDTATAQVSLIHYDATGRPGTPTVGSLPAGFDLATWNHISMDLDPGAAGGPSVTATLENSDRNPIVDLFSTIPERPGRRDIGVSLFTDGARADFDNVTLAQRMPRVATMASPPAAGVDDQARSDGFGDKIGPQWRWLREDPSLHGFASSGALELTTNGHLDSYQRVNADRNNSPQLPLTKNVLLQDAPDGDFMAETKLHFDPQMDNLSAGMAIYSDDDHHVSNLISWNGMLTQIVSIRNNLTALPAGASCPLAAPVPGANVATTRYSAEACPPRSEHHSQEYPAATRCCWDGNGRADDPSRITVYLRLYRQGNVVTPWYSLDGKSWTRENAWTLKAASKKFPLKIALYASSNHHANDPAARAKAWFDYVKVRPLS